MEQQVTITGGKINFREYLEVSNLEYRAWRYGFFGFMLLSIIGDIVIRNVSGIIYSLLFLIGYELFFRYTSKKNFHFRLNSLQKEKETNISADGIETKAIDGSLHVITQWDEFSKVKENKKVIYLMTWENGGHFFLKKNFTSEQLIQFESLMKSILDPKLFKKDSFLKYLCLGMLIRLGITCVFVSIDHFFK